MSRVRRGPSIVYWLDLSLYLNITNRCPNNCYFCIRRFKNGIGGFNLKLRVEPTPSEVIKELQKVINRRHWREVVFCGFGEPLERLDCILEVTRWIKKYSGLPVRIDTNGQGFLLNRDRDVIRELKDAGVDRISVSLNAHNRETYDRVCRPKFEGTFEAILLFVEKARGVFDTEITAVAIPEADINEVREIAERMGVRFRLREYIPCFW